METENLDIYKLTGTRRLEIQFNHFTVVVHIFSPVFDENKRIKLNPLNIRCNFARKVKIRGGAAESSLNEIKVAAITTTVQRRLSRN